MEFYIIWLVVGFILWGTVKYVNGLEAEGNYSRLLSFVAYFTAGAVAFSIGYWALFIGYTTEEIENGVTVYYLNTNPIAGGILMAVGVIYTTFMLFGLLVSSSRKPPTEQQIEQHKQKQIEQIEQHKQTMERAEKDLQSTIRALEVLSHDTEEKHQEKTYKIMKALQEVSTEREKVFKGILKTNTILNNIDKPQYIDESIQELEADLKQLHIKHQELTKKEETLLVKAEIILRKKEESTK